MASTAAKRVLLGRIAGAHGVRGELLVHSYTGNPEDIAAYGPLTDEAGVRSFPLEIVRVTPKGVIARIQGIDKRTAAEALRDTRLYTGRDRLPETAAEEFYLADLVGLKAVSPDKTAIGEVVGIQNYGAGDLLEIRREDAPTTELIPFTAQFVPEVDVAAGRVVVVIPPIAAGEEEP